MKTIKSFFVPAFIVFCIVAYMLFYSSKINEGFDRLYEEQQEQMSSEQR